MLLVEGEQKEAGQRASEQQPEAGPSGLASAAAAQPESDRSGANNANDMEDSLDATPLVRAFPQVLIHLLLAMRNIRQLDL